MQARLHRRWLLSGWLLLTLTLGGTLVWRNSHAQPADPAKKESAKKAPTKKKLGSPAESKQLGGPSRFLMHAATDKPIYRPGEKLYLRAVCLHHVTRKPMPGNHAAALQIIGPKGDVVGGAMTRSQDGVFGFGWEIPKKLAGGQYTAKVLSLWTGDPPAERKFEIRAYRAPRLKTQIKFLRDGYGPGDHVAAWLHVERAEGGIPAGAQVTVTARVDGKEVFRGPAKVDEQGNCPARFRLPLQIARGEGTLAMIIRDGGVVETAAKTLPILLLNVDLSIYPEGGDLIADLPARVYFEARTPRGKPADLVGVIVDDAQREVARFRSQHDGRGRFEFTPRRGARYEMKITEPAGISTGYPLPALKTEGAVLRAAKNTFGASEPVTVTVAARSSQPLVVTLRKRENVVARANVSLADLDNAERTAKCVLQPKGPADGVLIATVSTAEGTPLAERLVYRKPERSLNIKLSAGKPQYTPGGKAVVTVRATDENGKPIRAVVGLNVTDETVLEMIDKREQAPRLPVMVFLEGEVQELADAHVYLDPQNDRAPLAVDLLLGTQGWRRFALMRVPDFVAQHGSAARRVLAYREPQSGGFGFGGGGGGIPMAFAENEKAKFALPAVRNKSVRLSDIARRRRGAARANRAPAGKLAPAARQQNAQAAKPRRELKQPEGQKRDLLADRADIAGPGGAFGGPRPIPFQTIRIYAHAARKNRQPGQRIDFTETLFWHAGLQTDDKGEAKFEFDLNDSVTSFRVSADAFDTGGALGSASLAIQSVKPFYIEPKLPMEVTRGDRIQVPIALVNAADQQLTGGQIRASGPLGTKQLPFSLAGNGRSRVLLDLPVGGQLGTQPVTLQATGGPFKEQVTRSIRVQPFGFPSAVTRGGMLAADGTIEHTIRIPKDRVAGSLTANFSVYPTPLASMTAALERLIREPSGCFEQTSSTTYPLVMAQQYFLSHEGVDPRLIERSDKILEKGYKRLLGFECKRGGFEWFGRDPGHDALTAYGLLEFTDMAQVRHVDPAMIERTRKWLLAQRDGKGGFVRKQRTLHTWLPDPEVSNTYNLWALLEAGIQADLSKEVDWVERVGENSRNAYVSALAANVLKRAQRKDGLQRLLDKLTGNQTADGSLQGATKSVVGSGGIALQIETTALAATAWLDVPGYETHVEKAIKFIANNCQAGRYGSTQATVLALRAIVAYDASRARPKAPGSLQLFVDDKPVGKPVPFTERQYGVLALPDFASELTPGEHQVRVRMKGGSEMPFSLAVDLHRSLPDSSRDCQMHLEVRLRDDRLQEGGATEARVVAINRSDEALPSPLAIVGLPGGLEVRHDQLEELVKEEKIAAYEVRGRDVVLYWRVLVAEQRVELPLSLIAAVPGQYTGPASRAYASYTDEHKTWVPGLKVKIEPR